MVSKQLIVGLIVVGVVGLVVAAWYNQPANKASNIATNSQQQTAQTNDVQTDNTEGSVNGVSLMLSPNVRTVSKGETFSIEVILDTQGQQVDGVDIFSLNFDQDLLQVVDQDNKVSGVQVTAGTLMPRNIMNRVDNKTGQIQFSQVVDAGGSTFVGNGVLATVTFRAQKSGSASLKFDFKAGNTADTNVVRIGEDKLTSVNESMVTIK